MRQLDLETYSREVWFHTPAKYWTYSRSVWFRGRASRPARSATGELRMSGSEGAHGGIAVDHTGQLPRLRRIEGQVRGLKQMITSGRNCVDVAQQITAAIAALGRVRSDMLRDHLNALVTATVVSDLPDEERRRLADEIARLMAKVV